MKKILISLAILALVLGMMGMAGALPKLGANQGFSNPGSMVLGGSATIGGNTAVGGDLAVTGSISAGGGSTVNGVFSQDISMAAGYDFRTAVGASVFDWSNGTGLFKTTTGAITIGGGTNGITLNGPVTGVSAKDWTMVGASKLTIGSTGIQAVGGTIKFLNDTTFSGAMASTSGTFSGTVQAEQLTSTDDATVTDDLTVLGKADISETMTAEHITSTDDGVIADDFDVVGDVTAGTIGSDAGVTAVGTVQGEQLTSTDDITATDDLNAHDAIITGDVGTATVTASGQVKAEDRDVR